MDSDDLSDEAYAIIADACATSGLLGSILAASGSKARSESEFLHCMATALRGAAGGAEDCWEDHDVFTSTSPRPESCSSASTSLRLKQWLLPSPASWPRAMTGPGISAWWTTAPSGCERSRDGLFPDDGHRPPLQILGRIRCYSLRSSRSPC